MTLLDEIINGATDDTVTTANLLRKVKVVAHRVQADELKLWVERELNGYSLEDDLPSYRADKAVNVLGQWSGPGGSGMVQALGSGRLADKFTSVLFRVNFYQPLAELEDLAQAEDEVSIPWDPAHTVLYNRWGVEGLVPRVQMMNVISARRVITTGLLRGVIDSARNAALDFALELQTTAPDAGTQGGPTVADAPVAQVVWNVTNHINGDGAQVAQGENIRQKVKINKGDLPALLQAASAETGLEEAGTDELARVVLGDDVDKPSKITGFLERVREGAFAIGTGITADVAAAQIGVLIAAYLGQS